MRMENTQKSYEGVYSLENIDESDMKRYQKRIGYKG